MVIGDGRAHSPPAGSRGPGPDKSAQSGESPAALKEFPCSQSTRGLLDDPVPVDAVGATTGDLYELISKLLDKGSSVMEQQHAMRSLQLLLKQSAEPPNSWSSSGSPLGAVVRAGRTDLARLLLRARANVNECDAKGVSLLHVATYDGNSELCRVLLMARADVDACDRHGQTPLFFVPNRDVCKIIIEWKADVSVLNRKGQSALHLAGRAGLHEVLAWLTSRVSKSLASLRDVHGAMARNYLQQTREAQLEARGEESERGGAAQDPRTSKGHGNQPPSNPLRVVSPRKPPVRTASPPLRVRGGGRQAKSPPVPTKANDLGNVSEAALPTDDAQQGSAQLPSMSNLVVGRSADSPLEDAPQSSRRPSTATGRILSPRESSNHSEANAAYEVMDVREGAPDHAAALLEAAAAVATAAMATAAELDAAQSPRAGGAEDGTATFDGEADDLAELGIIETEDGVETLARRPGAGTLEADRSEMQTVEEMDEDLADLGIVDDDDALVQCLAARTSLVPADADGSSSTSAAVAAAVDASEARHDALPEAPEHTFSPDRLLELGIVDDGEPAAEAAAAAVPLAATGGPPSPSPLRALEEELDEVF